MFESILGRLAAGENLSMAEMSAAIEEVVAGRTSEGEIGLLLTALRAKGETPEELAGAAAALRRHMTPIRTTSVGVVDTCGTGGDASGTFNISTAAALVAAAAGVPVAKHGNRRVTSKSGSADVLAALGVNVDADPELVGECLDRLGICFCFAPLLHPAMSRVAEVRRKLGTPTIFNLIGPLSNPAGRGSSWSASARPSCGPCWPRRSACWAPSGRWSCTARMASTRSRSRAPPALRKSLPRGCAISPGHPPISA